MANTGHHVTVRVNLPDDRKLTALGRCHTNFYLSPYVACPKKGVLIRRRKRRDAVSPFHPL